MPVYANEKQNLLVSKEMAQGFMTKQATRTKFSRDRALFAILYLTGARPFEVSKLRRKDFFELPENPQFVNIRLWNAKQGRVRKFKSYQRVLCLDKDSAFMAQVLDYVNRFKDLEALVFPISPDRIRRIIYRMSDNVICPYTLRHSRHFRLGTLPEIGLSQLMAWKGARDARSVGPYLAGKANMPRKID